MGELGSHDLRAGAFAPRTGTTLQVVTFVDDIWSIVPDGVAIYQHLTGDPTNAGFTSIESDVAGDTVHAMYVSEPQRVVRHVCVVACRGRLASRRASSRRGYRAADEPPPGEENRAAAAVQLRPPGSP